LLRDDEHHRFRTSLLHFLYEIRVGIQAAQRGDEQDKVDIPLGSLFLDLIDLSAKVLAQVGHENRGGRGLALNEEARDEDGREQAQ